MALDQATIPSPPVTVVETPVLGLDKVNDPQLVHAITLPIPSILSGVTTPPASSIFSDRLQLVAGALTLDLQALPQGNIIPDIDLTGQKIQILQFTSPETNLADITISPGAVNGYELGGAAMSVTLAPGDTILFLFNDNAPDVANLDSEIDFAGSLIDDIDILIVAG